MERNSSKCVRFLRLLRSNRVFTVFCSMSEETPADLSHDQHAVRRQKLADLRESGADPFRAEVKPTHFSAAAIAAHIEGEDLSLIHI